MAIYAGFDAFEEHRRGALATVWKARRAGSDGVFAVKVCHPSGWEEEGADTAKLLAEMNEAVADIRALNQQGAKHWVPVLESGVSGEEGFWVTRFFPRSLERVIAGRLRLPAADIVGIALAVAQGCRELETMLQRPHGNLKTSNVFIDGLGKLRGAPILLSDPKPRSLLVLPADRAADFRALGRMVVHLLRERETDLNAAIGWPLEAGGEWKRLGRAGDPLRELCNLLLKPNPAPGEHDWAGCERTLAKLAKGQARPWPAIAAASTAVVLLGGSALYLRLTPYESLPHPLRPWAERLGNIPQDVAVVPPEWGQLCQAYYDWVGAFLVVANDPVKSAEWSRQPYLHDKVLAPLVEIQQQYGSLDPRKLANVDGDLLNLEKEPPSGVKKGEVAVRLIEAAHAVGQALVAYRQWPLRLALGNEAKLFAQHGWTGPAAQLQHVFNVGGGTSLVADNFNDVLQESAVIARTDTLWAELDRRAGVLNTAGDPVMRGIRAYFLARGAEATDLDGLNRLLSDLEDDSARWLSLVQGPGGQPRFDRARFAQESALHGYTGVVTAEVVAQWEQQVQDYEFVASADDPRRAIDWTALFRAVDDSIAGLAEEEKAANGGGASAASAGFRSRTDAAHHDLDTMLATPLVKKSVAPALADAQKLEANLKALAGEVRDALFQLRPNTGDWLAKVRQVSIGPAGSALSAEWQTRRDRLLAGADPAQLSAQLAQFRALREQYSQLEKFYTTLAGPQGWGGFAAVDEREVGPDFVGLLRTWAAARTQQAEVAWLGLVTWDGAVPHGTAEDFLGAPATKAIQTQLAAGLQEGATFGRELTVMQDHLGQGYGLEDSHVAGLAQWQARPVFAEFGKADAIQRLVDAVATLQSLSTEQKPDVLIPAAGSPTLGIALAAWRRLGAAPNWPAVADLPTELRLQADLKPRVQKFLRDDGARAQVRAEFAAAAIARWRTAFGQAQDDAAVGAALAQRDAFGVALDALSGPQRFNAELYQLKQVDWHALATPDLIAQRDAGAQRLRRALGKTTDPEVAAWLKRIETIALVDTPGKQSDLRKLGPGAAGWTGELASDGRQVSYQWGSGAQAHTLVFKLVDSPDTVPFFLGTTAIPVGLVIDLAQDPKVNTGLMKWLAQVASADDDNRNGPQVWRIDRRRGLILNDRWTGVPLPTWPAQLYPADVTVSAPTRDVPFQYLPPAAALYLAHDVLGCRLPTPAEWAAVVKLGLPAASAGSRGFNFRDATWKREHDYLVGAGLVDGLPIEGDIFSPRTVVAVKTGRESQAVAGDRNDGSLWFEPVGSDSPDTFHDLFGNVAQYLYDPATGKYSVAGASALSPPEVDPAQTYPVELAFAQGGYSDVGMRLAIDAPEGLANRNRLQFLIRSRPYLHS